MPGRQLASRLLPAPGGPIISLLYLIKFKYSPQFASGNLSVPKAYSYIRMSTPEQRQGHSTERQYEATKAYADTHGLDLEDIILDEGVSAFHGQNADIGKLSEFLRAVGDGRVERGSYLIVESLDRITRQDLFPAMALLDRIRGGKAVCFPTCSADF
ncbi:MAG: recombinase family protein [Novosphingobium sp.]